ncbi:DUF6531 domain-containing protein [Motiliproteus sp. MSK22-1]|uniref:DUF6531 domain-containing protein n=1 Tax=Motiliproteus sp. MSK22-1 TaxID=1897630 RepID=UPI0009765406|nr:DUF6531 domain-containing protein [Motiliproteus sp. MSK22-1]OMH39302.1 hypothetical protein BGP75_04235 [Motiliproteus sp. MSK22-1]
MLARRDLKVIAVLLISLLSFLNAVRANATCEIVTDEERYEEGVHWAIHWGSRAYYHGYTKAKAIEHLIANEPRLYWNYLNDRAELLSGNGWWGHYAAFYVCPQGPVQTGGLYGENNWNDARCDITQVPSELLNQCSTPTDGPGDKSDGGPACYGVGGSAGGGGSSPQFVGNPVNISTGNKFQQETDLSSSGSSSLILKRSYNSSNGLWRYSYGQKIYSEGTDASVVRADGKTFTYTFANGSWNSDGDVYHLLEENVDGYAWKLSLKSGAVEYYDDQGRLVLLEAIQGQQQSLTYVDNSIVVSNDVGDQLTLEQDDQGVLQSALLNGTENITYGYDPYNRLVSVTRTDNTSRQYHYENPDYPFNLTGITDERGIRFASWGYDDQGRANSSEHAGQERTELVFNADGSTTVTNPLGKQTTYHFAEIEGLKRITQVEGHASANCLAANKDYTYYANGLLKTRTDWQGVTTRFEYNDRGLKTRRIEAEGTPQERITTWTWDPIKPLSLTRTEGGKTTQYEYNSSGQMIRKQDRAAQ